MFDGARSGECEDRGRGREVRDSSSRNHNHNYNHYHRRCVDVPAKWLDEIRKSLLPSTSFTLEGANTKIYERVRRGVLYASNPVQLMIIIIYEGEGVMKMVSNILWSS